MVPISAGYALSSELLLALSPARNLIVRRPSTLDAHLICRDGKIGPVFDPCRTGTAPGALTDGSPR